MIERVINLVDQQYISCGSVYEVLNESIRIAITANPNEDLETIMKWYFPRDIVKIEGNEVYIVRNWGLIKGMFRFYV